MRGPNGKHIGLKTSGTVPDDTWTNYVCIFVGTGGSTPTNTFFNIYENGVDITTVSIDTGNITDISGVSIPFSVGTRDDVAASTFEGNIDEFLYTIKRYLQQMR